MPDIVMVIAREVFRDEEYAEPKRVLESHGARVATASTAPGKCIGKLGLEAQAELSLLEAAHGTWDAAVFVGGGGAAVFFDDRDAHLLARNTLDSGGVVGAICIAPSVLARAGLLTGCRPRRSPPSRPTSWRMGRVGPASRLRSHGRIVTANGPDAAAQFGETLADVLGI